MATAKEIRTRIASVQSTKKITSAMEMIAASKMRKARDRMDAAVPYARHIQEVIHHLAHARSEYKHPFMQKRPIKRVGIIVVSSDRGLCGGLNINLFKEVLNASSAWVEDGYGIDSAVIGQKAEHFLKRVKTINMVSYVNKLGDAPGSADVIGSVQVMLDAYSEGKIDALYLFHNEFASAISQKPKKVQLLPLELDEDTDVAKHHWDYIYEPDAKSLLDMLLVRYVEYVVYEAVVENIACEQAARMMAMKNASDNAQEVIGDLQLQYNKARQAAITRELSEIVSGADALDE